MASQLCAGVEVVALHCIVPQSGSKISEQAAHCARNDGLPRSSSRWIDDVLQHALDTTAVGRTVAQWHVFAVRLYDGDRAWRPRDRCRGDAGEGAAWLDADPVTIPGLREEREVVADAAPDVEDDTRSLRQGALLTM